MNAKRYTTHYNAHSSLDSIQPHCRVRLTLGFCFHKEKLALQAARSVEYHHIYPAILAEKGIEQI